MSEFSAPAACFPMYDGGWRRVALDYGLIGYHMGSMNDYPEAQCVINESHLGYAAYGGRAESARMWAL